jgi:signal peptidase I
MDNKEKESADLSARLDESELLKPGTAINPGQSHVEKPETKQSQEPNHETANQAGPEQQPQADMKEDVVEFNKFVAAQEEAGKEIEQPKTGALHIIWEISKTILIAAAVVIFINTFVFQAYYVSGSSMTPTFQDKDYLLVNKFPTSVRNILKIFGNKGDLNIARGEVLIFRPPENPEIFYVKRAIGLPGDRVVLKDGVFTIYNKENPNGLRLDEKYVDPAFKTEGEIDEVVTPGNVFVVGDNRAPGGSYDSRAWGQLPQDKIIGDAFFRLIPLNSIGFISDPKFNSN